MKNKIIAVVLAILMVCGIMPFTAVYAQDEHQHSVVGFGIVTFTAWTDALAKEQNGSSATAANSLPSEEGTYYLENDVTTSGEWSIVNKNITLCLNGKSIIANFDGNVINVGNKGELTICDCSGDEGVITHKSGQRGRGVAVSDKSGIFNLASGSIAGNIRTAHWWAGGGVYVKGTFNMYGGLITLNASGFGGGVAVDYALGTSGQGKFNMYGGAIMANVAYEAGGGVYSFAGTGSITLGGESVISSNLLNTKINNVELDSGDKLVVDGLKGESVIGVTTYSAPTEENDIVFTTAADVDYKQYFTSDKEGYAIWRTVDDELNYAVILTTRQTKDPKFKTDDEGKLEAEIDPDDKARFELDDTDGDGEWFVYPDDTTPDVHPTVSVSVEEGKLVLESTDGELQPGTYWVAHNYPGKIESKRIPVVVLPKFKLELEAEEVLKNPGDEKVEIELKNDPIPDGEWKVYPTNDATEPFEDIKAELVEGKLVLKNTKGELPAGKYYVSLTRPGKPESDRIEIIVSDNIPEYLEGTVTIEGTLKWNETLTAVVESNAVTPLHYQWYRGDVKVGTDSANYLLGASDIGRELTVVVTAEKSNGELMSFKTDKIGYKYNRFVDIPNNAWYEGAALWCDYMGYITGTSDTTFSPEIDLTRAMMVQIIAMVEGVNFDEITYSGTFSDVKAGDWYAKAVEWAVGCGVTKGTGNGKFSPKNSLTREQLATFFLAYANYKKYNTEATTELTAYKDASTVSSWALKAVKWAIASKLISGTTNTTIGPKAKTNRAQMAVIVRNFVENIVEA